MSKNKTDIFRRYFTPNLDLNTREVSQGQSITLVHDGGNTAIPLDNQEVMSHLVTTGDGPDTSMKD